MKIDLDWIQEELDSGREVKLEGINGGYINKDNYVLSIEDGNLVVSFGTSKLWISSDNFKHFRIKRPTPTFSDLIDVAVKAYKDGVIDNLEITKGVSGGAGVLVNGNRQFTNSRPKDGIDFINSLYTETFVIESEKDINKVNSRKEISFSKKHMSVAKLMNGNEILITKLDSDNSTDVVVYMRNGLYKNYLDIEVLKGAIVTQQKGNK